MTTKLYDLDAYATSFDAMVVSGELTSKFDNCVAVVLDQTLFFPEEGGQTPDCGRIDGFLVKHVSIKDNVITHYICCDYYDEETDSVNTYSIDDLLNHFIPCKVVHGKIDWEHRFNNMQQHSGEHIFSGIINTLYGLNNVGFHLSDSIVTCDYDGALSKDEIANVERLTNEAIIKNVPITCYYPPKDELMALDYRSKIDFYDGVRIVNIEGYDICACCAPHVKSTGEIQFFKVIRTENYKAGIRVSILCGKRATAEMAKQLNILYSLGEALKSNTDGLESSVALLLDKTNSQKQTIVSLNRQLFDYQLGSINPSSENVLLFTEVSDMKTIRDAVNNLVKEHSGIVAVFSGSSENYNYIIASESEDMKILFEKMKSSLDAKGGGSSKMYQGSVLASEASIRACLCLS